MLRVKALPFSDVSLSDWYCDAVLAVYEKGLMLGESAAGFGPNSPVTLEMLCTVLHRLDDQPGRDEDSSSIDWAVQTGLFDVGDPGALDLSSPAARSGPVSREAVCAVLVEYGRYAGVEELAVPTNAATPLNTATFADIEQASDWARDYVRIAQAVGLISGDGDGFCRPLDTVSRAELATMLMRLLGLASPE